MTTRAKEKRRRTCAVFIPDAALSVFARIVRMVVEAIRRAIMVAILVPAAALVGPLVVVVGYPAIGRVRIALALGDEMAGDPYVLAVVVLVHARRPHIAFAMLDDLHAGGGRGHVDVDFGGEGGKHETGERGGDAGENEFTSHHEALLVVHKGE